jgi:hypothetical protein
MPGNIAIPDLVIPVRMDIDKAIDKLNKMAGAGKKAADDTEEATKKTKKTLEDTGTAASVLGDQLLKLGGAAAGAALVRRAFDAVFTRAKDVSAYVSQMAKDFIELRQALQQIAALKGQANENEFAITEVRKAAAARLMPQEWKAFQEAFQSYAGAQLEGPAAKLTLPQAETYQQKVAEFMKAEGVAPQLGAELAGTLLETAKGPQDVEKLMSSFGRVYETLKKSRTPVEQLLPQMARITAYGVSPEDAAQLLSVIAPGMPGEEQTGIENTFKAIRELKLGGKAAEYGIDTGATKYEQVKQLAENIQGRIQKGEDIDKILQDAKIQDMREFRGIQAFAYHGVEMGGFARYQDYNKGLADTHTKSVIENYEKSRAGREAKRRADAALSAAELGERNAKVEELKMEAETQLRNERRLETLYATDFARGAIGKVTGIDVNQQLIQERAVQLAYKEAGIAGPLEKLTPEERAVRMLTARAPGAINVEQVLRELAQYREERVKAGLPVGADVGGEPSEATEAAKETALGVKELVRLQVEAMGGKAAPPLSAPPPQGNNLRQAAP